MAKRKGLLLDRSGEVATAVEKLGLPDWDFRVVSCMEAANRILTTDPPLIGLVAFDSLDSWPTRDLEALLARQDIEWIAVLTRELLLGAGLTPAILRGFHDFHTLPLEHQRLVVTLGHAHGKAMICKRMADEKIDDNGRYGMIGRSPKMLQLYHQIDQIISVDAPVLIGGESGTGKELVARAIHRYSKRAGAPFVVTDCATVPPGLIYSELFGHEAGAMPGARARKIGCIEAADGGVVFLDQIADLPLDVQATLLRFLQEKTIIRLGSTERIRVNVRVVAASHVDLAHAVSQGRFRQDFYYRLNVLHLRLPPLREREGDVAMLANAIFLDNQHQKSPHVKGFSSEALQAMQEYAWPGNVRELDNRVRQATIMAESKLIAAADLGLTPPRPTTRTLDEVRASVERDVIRTNLHRYKNNVSEVARQLGVSRVTLYRMMDRLRIVP